MAGKQVGGDNLPANLAGMTKNQLYEIMCQMKTLIEQNQQQARQILIQNPLLTKALFQAQIMLGMVQPPQVVPKVESQVPQQTQPPVQAMQHPSIQQAPQSLSGAGMEQPVAPQMQTPIRKPHLQQPPMPMPSSSAPAANVPSQPLLSHPSQPPQQRPGHLNPTTTSMPLPHSSQAPNVPSLHQQPQMPASSTHMQHPVHSGGIPHMPPQQQLPPQPRPSSMPTYHHQYGPPQTGQNLPFQHHGVPQHLSQPMFHSGSRPLANPGSSFPQGQPPPQSMYQRGGSHFGGDFNNQIGGPMVPERGSSWMSGPLESSTMTQLQGGPPSVPQNFMGPGNQPPRPAGLTPEMEKALLQQVMSLTPEQISLLPPEQRNQVLQLQQMLRQ